MINEQQIQLQQVIDGLVTAFLNTDDRTAQRGIAEAVYTIADKLGMERSELSVAVTRRWTELEEGE